DSRIGLSSSEAARRLERHGANRLAEAPREARWRSFLRQFQDLLIVILLAAAVVSLTVTWHWETRRDRLGCIAQRDHRLRPGVPGGGVAGGAQADARHHCDGPPRRPHPTAGRGGTGAW